jgi:hypothetical protein
MKITILKFLSSKGKILEIRKDNFKGKDLPKNIIEEYEIEIKGEDFVETDWYEDENMVGKLLKAENSQTGLNELCIFKHKGKDSITAIGLDGKEFIGFFSNFRPATESEVLSLVYKPQQKLSKEINLIESKAESNRLKGL